MVIRKQSIIIQEKQCGNLTYFRKKVLNDNSYTLVKDVKLLSYINKEDDTYSFILYNSNLEVYTDLYYYINDYLNDLSIKTRENYFYFVKQLYVFLELFEIEVDQIKKHHVIQFLHFLSGNTTESDSIRIYLLSNRNSKTVNEIVLACSNYLKWTNNKCYKHFNNTRIYGSKGYQNSSYFQPKHITTDDFDLLRNYIANLEIEDIEKLKYRAIFELMFYSSLRIGEALGLTLEDIQYRRLNNNFIYYVVIRNRLSDKNHQLAKCCMNIRSRSDYDSSSYLTQNVGFEIAYITKNTYDNLQEYIEHAHLEFSEKRQYSKHKADQVTNSEFAFGNRYVFLNRKTGTPLSRVQANKFITRAFEEIGLETDKGFRHLNLNHRFRHGFVMRLLYENRIPPHQVIKLSRHRNIDSLESYNHLSPNETSKIIEDFDDFINGESK